VKPDELKSLAESTDFDNQKVYLCQVTAQDYCVDAQGNFSWPDYLEHPEKYHSIFHEKIAPYCSMILNGIFWTENYPRLLTIEQTEDLAKNKNLRLLTLADVSCDLNGSIQFMSKSSTIDDPFYMYDPISKKIHDE
jgi:alpha-aminoadipic semialdehyde synthase